MSRFQSRRSKRVRKKSDRRRARRYSLRSLGPIESLEERQLLFADPLGVSLSADHLLAVDTAPAYLQVVSATHNESSTSDNRVTLGESSISAAPHLPGLELVDTDTQSLLGQVIYLDTRGVHDLLYDGPVRVEGIDLPGFEAPGELAGEEAAILHRLLVGLNEDFSGVGVTFTAEQPGPGAVYSTIYLGRDDTAFESFGSFQGLAEKVDVGNTDRGDFAMVFTENLDQGSMDAYVASLQQVTAHEAGRLLGYANARQADPGPDHPLYAVGMNHVNVPGATIGDNVLKSTVGVKNKIAGLKGDDIYIYDDGWLQDQVVELANEGDDTIDLSRVNADVTIKLNANGILDDITSGTNNIKGNNDGDLVHIEKVIGGSKVNHLDLSAYAGPLTVVIEKEASKNKTTVKKTDGNQDVLLIAFDVTNITGGTGADEFLFKKGAVLDGWIDGGGGAGVNKLDYSDFGEDVLVDLAGAKSNSPGFFISTPIPKKGVKRIQNVTGGTPGFLASISSVTNNLSGDAAINHLVGASEKDLLEGRGEDDELSGLGGDDVLVGGSGGDTLTGGAGNDTYRFSPADFVNNEKDTVVEDPGDNNGVLDSLDFSSFPAGWTIAANVEDVINTGILVSAQPDAGVERGLFSGDGRVKNVEKVTIGNGVNNFNFGEGWARDFQISRLSATGVINLTFHRLMSDLIFEIDGTTVTVFEAQPDGNGGLEPKTDGKFVIADTVHDLTGGAGNNTFVFKNGGKISGALNVARTAGQRNVLDYSSYGEPVQTNLTNAPVDFGTSVANPVLFSNNVPALPRQEQYVYTFPVNGLQPNDKGTILFDPQTFTNLGIWNPDTNNPPLSSGTAPMHDGNEVMKRVLCCVVRWVDQARRERGLETRRRGLFQRDHEQVAEGDRRGLLVREGQNGRGTDHQSRVGIASGPQRFQRGPGVRG